ncbi:MAG: GHKL domain-containing protein [Bdellovibrionaceae bacterium]|nr:GHKL domain-containing protein [Bdellovibrionales bacterium]MCB9083321.1 GHKL domain-containing protein [Pseudobdellovibrionaceae bacterium]
MTMEPTELDNEVTQDIRTGREETVDRTAFPKVTGWAAIIATLVFITTQFYFQVSNRKAFRDIYETHFPIVERNSINLRLHERIMALVELAVTKGDAKLEEEHEIFMGALEQNQELTQYTLAPAKELGRAYQLPSRENLSAIELEIFRLLKDNNAQEARRLFESDRYLYAGDQYTGALQEVSEQLSTRRDAILESQNKSLTVGITLSLVAFTIVLVFWLLVMRGYALNLRLKTQAEHLLKEEQARTVQASKLSTLGEMAGGVAHEINNPLTIIQGYAEILGQQVKRNRLDPAQLTKISDGITATTARIAKIVRSLRTYARDDSAAPFQAASMGMIVDDTLSLCQEKLKNNNVRLDYTPPAEPIMIQCREVQVSQVLLNLVQNAMDAIDGHQGEKWIRVELNKRDQYCQMRVTDCGAGIPPDVQEKILQPFFTTKEIGKGTGLGLSISRSIMKDHKGRFFYDQDHPNTSFVAEIPLAGDRAKADDSKNVGPIAS